MRSRSITSIVALTGMLALAVGSLPSNAERERSSRGLQEAVEARRTLDPVPTPPSPAASRQAPERPVPVEPPTSTPPAAPSGAEVVTVTRVVDGDTFRDEQGRIRLEGIDTPEDGQTCEDASGEAYRCGERSTATLTELMAGGELACTWKGEDRYGRRLGECWAGGVNINEEIVRLGWARAFVRYSEDYVDEETEAREAGRGLWQGRHVAPWDWRRGER